MPKIKIPASTANLGPGFDCIGLALTMYNEIEFELMPKGLEIIVKNPDDSWQIPADESNLIYRSIQAGLKATGLPMPGIRIFQTDRIPQTRGLGSSSACVVGGIVAANIISDAVLSTNEMISIAAKIEGHPDNILPTFIGGMSAGVMENDSIQFARIEPPHYLKCCAMIPDFPLETKKARAILPKTVSLDDAIYNSSRSALMVAAMSQGRMDLLRTALGDALHQPYRKALIPSYEEIQKAAEENGAIGTYLSGAGPSMIAFLDRDYRQFVQRMKISTKNLPNNWKIELLDVCYEGVSWNLDD